MTETSDPVGPLPGTHPPTFPQVQDHGRVVPGLPPGQSLVRTTVVGQVYHHGADGRTDGLEVRFGVDSSSEDSPLHRVVRVDPQWTPLSLHWVTDCGFLCLTCQDGSAVQVGAGGVPFAVLKAGQSLPLSPVRGSAYSVRTVDGTARLSVFAVPR